MQLSTRWSALVACAAVALAATPAAASEPPPPPVVNGTTTSSYEYVGVLLACYRGYCQDFCSGSLITSDWVLTAGHCVEAIDEFASYGYTDFYVGFGRDVNSLTDYAEMDWWTEHPSYSASTLNSDIGLIELASHITSVTPVAVNSDHARNLTASSFTYVGYGITDDDANDSGTKRYADIPYYSYDSQFIYAYDSTGTYNVCSGDSGGAGLNSLGGSSYEVVAVNSFVASADGRTGPCDGGYTGGTRTDVFYSWIDGYTNISSGGSSSGSGSSGSGSSGSGSSGSGSSGSGDSGSSGSGSSGGDSGGDSGGSGSGGDSGGDSGGSDDGGDVGGDDGSTDTGAPLEGDTADPREWGETSAEPLGAPEKGGCSTVSGAAAPAAVMAWLGAMAVARRREEA